MTIATPAAPVLDVQEPRRKPSLAASDIEPREILPLVERVARPFLRPFPWIGIEELVSWGSVGAVDALESYQPSRGVPVSKWIAIHVRGRILDHLRIATQARRKNVPAQVPFLAGVHDAESSEDRIAQVDAEDFIMWASANLPRDHASVVRLHYLYGLKLSEIARVLGFKKTWVSTMHSSALARIRERIRGAAR